MKKEINVFYMVYEWNNNLTGETKYVITENPIVFELSENCYYMCDDDYNEYGDIEWDDNELFDSIESAKEKFPNLMFRNEFFEMIKNYAEDEWE